MKKINWKKLIIAILIPQIAGGIGSLFTTPKIQSWFVTLSKPFFSPPNWLFAPVWTFLFLMMGFSFYLIWTKKKLGDKVFNWFWIQLVLNICWSMIFFGMERPGLALIEIAILWVAIRKTIINFNTVNKTAAILLMPYLAWVSFATILNASLWWLNR